MSELQLIYDKLDGACCPEDIFGSGDDPSVVFKKLARICHPDRNPTEKIAEKTFKKLNELKQVADERVRKGMWGKRIPLPHCVPLEIGKYKAKPHPRIGDIADLYKVERDKLLIKVARSHDDNDLLRAEFNRLVEEWKHEVRSKSLMMTIAMHPAYQQMMGMGRKSCLSFLNESKERMKRHTNGFGH